MVHLQQGLSEHSQLIEYAVLRKRLLIWFVTKTRFVVIDQSISWARREKNLNEYFDVLALDDDNSVARERELAIQLHDCSLRQLKLIWTVRMRSLSSPTSFCLSFHLVLCSRIIRSTNSE